VRAQLEREGTPARVIESEASVGGGAFPSARIPSWAVSPDGDAMSLEQRLRLAPVGVIGRIVEGRLLLDVRSIPASDDAAFTSAVTGALA
jgi:L-seryl-tRNA(Ser) seleniumtransferase